MILLRQTLAASLILWLTTFGHALQDAAIGPEPHYARIARLFARELPREHLSHRRLDDDISGRALDNFLTAFDYDRAYFLVSDVEEFEAEVKYLDDRLKRGDVAFAYKVFDRFKERARDRVEFVNQVLEDGFDLGVEETYRWKRKEAPWCGNRSEWDELWRKRLKNDFIRRIVAREIREETAASDNVSSNSSETLTVSTNSLSCGFEIAPNTVETTADTDVPETLTVTDAEDKPPEELIADGYSQFLTTLEDNDSEWVLQKYLSSFARAFDPHCDYMSQSSVENFDIEMKLSLVGIGALLLSENGAAKIVRLIPGGPAARDTRDNRLLPNDRIIAVAQGNAEAVSILHWPLYKAVRLIRGKKDTKVVLTVIPASAPTGGATKLVDLIRDEVKLEDREAKSEIRALPDIEGNPRKFGVIRLPAFYADLKGKRTNPNRKSSSRDVARILREMREDDVAGVLLDLRNNGGGSLLEAVLMTGLFIKTGPTVQVRERFRKSILPDDDPSIVYSGPLVVLVNRLSASASEILAGALQDYGRAIIVGDSKTHGKGSVQTILPMSRDKKMGSIKVTSALFYRVSGASTQLRGVVPDIVIPSAFEYMELGEDFLSNSLEWSSVREVMYSPFGDFSPVITNIVERSRQRRDSDQRFAAYHELLGRLETLNKTEELSLNIERRREKARAEKELFDIQNELIEQSSGEGDDSEKPDLVLSESVNILSDLADFQNSEANPVARVAEEKQQTALEALSDWFK